MYSQTSEQIPESSVQVIIRLQPPFTDCIQKVSDQSLVCLNKTYNFDYIFSNCSTQEDVFNKIGTKMISSAKKGYNSCIFAYGQTGSGKTYTMTGTDCEHGLIQRCMMQLIKVLSSFESFELKMSYFEIYNEQINDLLANNQNKKKDSAKNNIKIKESLTIGFYVQNLQQVKIDAGDDMLELLERGLKSRTTAETKMNRESSRSHSILTLYINTREKKQNSECFSIKSSKMHFVDLAGSEKQKSTMAVGQRLKEASSINKSLTALSIVIEKLSAKATHIPYRDSVITKILRDSLGGNSRTILIAALSSSQSAVSETISTINFATKAKKVTLSARINEQHEGSMIEMRKRIKELEDEIKFLQEKQSGETKCQNCIVIKSEYQRQIDIMQKQIFNNNKYLFDLQERIQTINNFYQSKVYDTTNNPNHQDFLIKSQSDHSHSSVFSDHLSIIFQHNGEDTTCHNHPVAQIQNNASEKDQFELRTSASKSSEINNALNKSQELLHLFALKQLNDKIIIIQSQLRSRQLELETIHLEQHKKSEDSNAFFQPFLKQWVLNNGKAVKQAMTAKNSIHKQLLLGMRLKMNQNKYTYEVKENEWKQKQKQHFQTIQNLKANYDEFKEAIMTREREKEKEKERERSQTFSQQMTVLSKNLHVPQSKSHFRMSGRDSKLLGQKANNEKKQQIQKIQQQLDRLELQKSSIVEQLENYKLKQSRLIEQSEQAKELCQFWETKYNNLANQRKQTQRHFDELKEQNHILLAKLENINLESTNDKEKLKHSFNNSMKDLEIENMKLKEQHKSCLYLLEMCEQQLQNTKSEQQLKLKQSDELKHTLIKKIEHLNNQLHNSNKENQNLKMSCQKLEVSQKETESELFAIKLQKEKLKINMQSSIHQYNARLQNKDKEFNFLQNQNSNNYNAKMESQHNLKIAEMVSEMRLASAEQCYKKEKAEREKWQKKFEDLYRDSSAEQSQYYLQIHKNNEQKKQNEHKVDSLKQKIKYLSDQIGKKDKQIQFWKQQLDRQKVWANDFKKLQFEFCSEKKDLTRDKKINKFTNKEDSQVLDNWDNRHLKQKVAEISTKLSSICGIEVNETSLLHQLDIISKKISTLQNLQLQNNRSKNEQLTGKKLSANYWKNIQ